MNEANCFKPRCHPISGQNIDVRSIYTESFNLKNPIVTRSSTSGLCFPSPAFQQNLTLKPALYLPNGDPSKNEIESHVVRLNNDVNTVNGPNTDNNLFEPVCEIKTSNNREEIKSSKDRQKTAMVNKEDKKLFKAYNDTTCFVCDINFVDNDLLLDHLKEIKFFCRVCTYEFNNHSVLENHFTSHKGHKCLTCFEIFFCKRDMLQHFRKSDLCNRNTVRFECDLCDKTFARMRVLKKHKLTIHSSSEGKFECIVCKKEFSREVLLEKHLNSVHVVLEYIPCKICDKLYLGQKPLTTHMQQVHFENMKNFTFVCSICGKIFLRESTLKSHLVTHDQTEALCEHCGQTILGGKKAMQMHLYNNHSGKTFSCEVCSKQFDSKPKLRSHSRMHKETIDESKYCDVCGKKYKTANILKLHMAIHSDERNFKCDIGGATFKQKVTVNAQ